MRTLTHTLYYPGREQTFRLYYLTDWHIGARACAEDLLQQDVEAIKNDPFAYWIGGGDYIEAIPRKGDKRYIESTLAKWLRGKDDVVGQQRDRALEYIKPIASKCLGLVSGNHERACLKYADRDIYSEFCTLLGLVVNKPPTDFMLGVQGFLNLRFRRGTEKDYGGTWSMNVYCHHGFGGGRMPGGHALTLGRVLGDYDCDVAFLGHRHVRQFLDKTITLPRNRTRLKMAMFVPSYLNAYIIPSSEDKLVDTYAEEFGLPPQHIGTVPIVIKPDVHRMDAIMSNIPGILAA